jgi:hypothetical protein
MSDCGDFIYDNDVEYTEGDLEPFQKQNNFRKRGKDFTWEE